MLLNTILKDDFYFCPKALIMCWNLVDYWLLSMQKHIICEVQVSLIDINNDGCCFQQRISTMILRQHVTWTGQVLLELVAKQKWMTIGSEYLPYASGSSGTSRSRVTGYSMYSFQPNSKLLLDNFAAPAVPHHRWLGFECPLQLNRLVNLNYFLKLSLLPLEKLLC